MLRKLTNDKPQLRRGQAQAINLERAFNALGMIRSIQYAEEQYNSVFDNVTNDEAYRIYLQRPYLELLSGFGTKVDNLNQKSHLPGLTEVIEAIEEHYKERINAHAARFNDTGLVEFDGLAEVYRPGTKCVYRQANGLAMGVTVTWSKYEEGEHYLAKHEPFTLAFSL